MNRLLACGWLAAQLLYATVSFADTFGSGVNSFDIDFVTIGNPGNPPDANPNPAGAVSYEYRMGTYEISEQMIDKANALGGLGITKDSRGPDYPATSITWYEAARFVNWLNTSTGSTTAYKFDTSGNFQLWTPSDPGYDPNNLFRNSLARYFLPSVNEWHKAAYYNPSTGTYFTYPTGSSVPDGIDFPGDPNFDAVFDDGQNQGAPNSIFDIGTSGPYGTAAQGGNVDEWVETAFDRINSSPTEQRTPQGGSWADPDSTMRATNTRGGLSPGIEIIDMGFRVASAVPEPATLLLFAIALTALLTIRMRLL